jgi:hypothetical protein
MALPQLRRRCFWPWLVRGLRPSAPKPESIRSPLVWLRRRGLSPFHGAAMVSDHYELGFAAHVAEHFVEAAQRGDRRSRIYDSNAGGDCYAVNLLETQTTVNRR